MSKPICFTPYSWAKLCYLRDKGDTEIGAFGMAETDDPLLITDIYLPEQECAYATVDLDGASLLKYRAECRAAGLDEKHSFRIWIHTHPNMSAKPSGTDEKTFEELFGGADWGVMLIVSKSEETYARVKYGGNGPQSETELDIEIDYGAPFGGTQRDSWDVEYDATVTKKVYTNHKPWKGNRSNAKSYGSNNAQNSSSGATKADKPYKHKPVAPWVANAAEAEKEEKAKSEIVIASVDTVPPYEPETESLIVSQPTQAYDVRNMWCMACHKGYEICDDWDKTDATEDDICQFCGSDEVYEVDSYKLTL